MPMRKIAALVAAVTLISVAPASAQDDPKTRIKMARDAIKEGSRGIPALVPMLKDPDLGVRVEATKALAEIGTQHSLAPLIEAARDNDAEVQIRAIDGLTNFYYPGFYKSGLAGSLTRAGNTVRARFSDRDDRVIDAWVTVRPEVIAVLGRLARGAPDWNVRAEAARALGVLRGKAALPDLYSALKSKNDRSMYEALIAVQKIGEPASGNEVIFLLRDLEPKIQTAAIETAGMFRTKTARPPLIRAYETAEKAEVRRAAILALAQIADPLDRPLLLRALTDRDDAIRAAGAEGLGRVGNSSDVGALLSALVEEKKAGAQLSMAFALVLNGRTGIGDNDPLRLLIDRLNTKAWRGVASPLLQEAARQPAVLAALHTAMQDSQKAEAMELAAILGAAGNKESEKLLEGLSRNPDSAVADAGVRALRTLRARRAN